MHCFYSERFLVTVHRDERPAFTRDPRAVREARASRSSDPALLLYRIVDGLVDSFFPILADFDDRIDELENADLPATPSDAQLQEIFAMKRLLVGLRKAITPQRDMFAQPDGRRRRAAGDDARTTSATSATSTTT